MVAANWILGPSCIGSWGEGTTNEPSQEIAHLNIVLGRVSKTPKGPNKSKISAVMCSFSCRHHLKGNKGTLGVRGANQRCGCVLLQVSPRQQHPAPVLWVGWCTG